MSEMSWTSHSSCSAKEIHSAHDEPRSPELLPVVQDHDGSFGSRLHPIGSRGGKGFHFSLWLDLASFERPPMTMMTG
eukprot:9269582-Heterocapsa_arctica.AAC.1